MVSTRFRQLFLRFTAVLGNPASPTAIAATTAAPPTLAATDADPANVIWLEGERPTKSTMTRHPWWYDQVKKDVLSGGDWISKFTKDKVGKAGYAFPVVAPDKQTGTRYSADGTRLAASGTAPLLLEPVQAAIRFIGANPARVAPCDHYGVPLTGKTVPLAAAGSFPIDGTYRTYYYEVKR